MLSLLHLDNYLLEALVIETNPAYAPDTDIEQCYDVKELDFDIAKHVERPAYRVHLTFDLASAINNNACGFRRIKISLTGFFSYSEEATEDFIQQTTPCNQLSILFGVARGIVASATGATLTGPFILPSINFYEAVKNKANLAGDVDENAKALPIGESPHKAGGKKKATPTAAGTPKKTGKKTSK